MLLRSKLRPFLLPLMTSFAVACIDETIQMFIPGRGPGIKDVGIDTMGATVGIVFITCIYQLKKHFKENNQ